MKVGGCLNFDSTNQICKKQLQALELDYFQYYRGKKNKPMETSTMPPKSPRLIVQEDALASQVLEIIGGITREALQTLEEPEERDVWSMEEGDDSVFYSDEDQAHQGIKANSADERIPQREDDRGEESIIDNKNSDMEKEVTPQVILTEQEEERQDLQTPENKFMDQSDAADAGAQSTPTPEKSVSTCGESLQLNCTIADMQTQSEQSISTEKGKTSLVLLCSEIDC